jgi:LysR family glycine cleavage system transcriptional activator
MPRRLLPLNALRAFEASARLLSFKEAAEELHVTPAAISHQVKSLEELLGRQLFRRLTRQLVLTEAAQLALPELRQGFAHLQRASELLQSESEDKVLTVSVAPTFAAKWLVPRLIGFQEAHPDIEVRISATDYLVDFETEDVDAAVRFGPGEYPGLQCDYLLSASVAPVCSPKLLEGATALRTPEDLADHTLLHLSDTRSHEAAPAWRMWLKAAGVPEIDSTRGPKFSSYVLLTEAAMAGQGVALIETAIIGNELASGRLVRLFCDRPRASTGFCYYFVTPERRAGSRKIQAFREWIVAEGERFRTEDNQDVPDTPEAEAV